MKGHASDMTTKATWSEGNDRANDLATGGTQIKDARYNVGRNTYVEYTRFCNHTQRGSTTEIDELAIAATASANGRLMILHSENACI